jgi:hypothetical protein
MYTIKVQGYSCGRRGTSIGCRRSNARPQRPSALFRFFEPKSSTKKSSIEKDEILDQILRLTADCDAGFNVTGSDREIIAGLVDDLRAYCVKSPLTSSNIFGRWVVRYASKPTTAGGPFKTLPGRVVFPGQTATQVLEEPNVCINEISFKTLGFIPGTVTQEGTIDAIDGNSFEITFTTNTGKRMGGPPKRMIEILYLDENVRIARAIPQDGMQESGFYVFTREGVEFEFDDNDEDPRESVPAAEQAKLERAAAAEQAKLERAAAAEQAKLERAAAAEQARREREDLIERKAAAKALYAELSSEAREAAASAQATARELAVIERDGSKIARAASAANRSIEKAENFVESLETQFAESQAKEVALEKEILALQRQLNAVGSLLTQTRKSMSPKK